MRVAIKQLGMASSIVMMLLCSSPRRRARTIDKLRDELADAADFLMSLHRQAESLAGETEVDAFLARLVFVLDKLKRSVAIAQDRQSSIQGLRTVELDDGAGITLPSRTATIHQHHESLCATAMRAHLAVVHPPSQCLAGGTA